MSKLVKLNNISYDMTLKLPQIPGNCKETSAEDIRKQTVAERINSKILNEMIDICFLKSTKNSYSDEYKAFAYSLYCSSELNYQSLRAHVPLPSESCLRKTFQPAVANLENHLSSIDQVQDLLLRRSEVYKIPKGSKINCTLVVDAFTTTTITPYCKEKYINGEKSNCFLFLIVPHSKDYKIFPAFMYQSPSGCQISKLLISWREL